MPLPVVLPGDTLSRDQLPSQSKSSRTLTLGPGVQFSPPSTLTVINSGTVSTESRKNSVWIENNGGGRYHPTVGDYVIATVRHSSVDTYRCTLASHAPQANLGQMAFEGVTRKTRPILQPGSLVYARISQAQKYLDLELECVHPSIGKAEGLGELKGGTLFDISLGMARRLLMNKPRDDGRIVLLENLGEQGLHFEVAVGRNGKVWINSNNIKTTIAIGRALQEADQNKLTVEEQDKLVKHIIHSGA